VNSSAPVLAIDFGGTKVAAAVVDADGTVVRRDQIPTRPTEAGTGDDLYAAIETLVEKVLDGMIPVGIGVGCGGPMNWATGEVSPLNVPAWRDYPLRQRLVERYPAAVVRLHNDAIAMAVGEHWCGAGRGAQRGCLEAIARGPAVVAWAVEQGWTPSGGAAVDGRALLTSARDGDPTAVAAFARAGRALGIALASTTYLLELDRVAIGGGLANSEDLLLGPAREAFDRHIGMDYTKKCTLTRAGLGGDAGLVGAAAFIHCGARYWPN
jgi:glucokinase